MQHHPEVEIDRASLDDRVGNGLDRSIPDHPGLEAPRTRTSILVPPPRDRGPEPATTAQHPVITLESTPRMTAMPPATGMPRRRWLAVTTGLVGSAALLASVVMATTRADDEAQTAAGGGAPVAENELAPVATPSSLPSPSGDGEVPPSDLPGPGAEAGSEAIEADTDGGGDLPGAGADPAAAPTGETAVDTDPDDGDTQPDDAGRSDASGQDDGQDGGSGDGAHESRDDDSSPAGPGDDGPDAGPGMGAVTEACFAPVLTETFDEPSLDRSVWELYDSVGNAGHGLRRPDAVTVVDGVLTITADMEDGQLVSGGLRHRYTQAYGRYEVRVRTSADESETMSGVVLTWPDSEEQRRDGENDFYETLAEPGDRSRFHSFIHRPGGTADQQDITVHTSDASEWRTVTMEWTPDALRLYRDGNLVKTITETSQDVIPDADHYLAIQLDAWDDSLPAPVTLEVDSISVEAFDPDRC
jgi:hypothetical protein